MTAGFLSLGIPGSGAETVGGANTTLAADAIAAALEITVASAASIAIGDFLRIGDAGETEIREVTDVVGTTISLAAGLGRGHDAGDQVREVDDAGTGTSVVDLWDDVFSGFEYPSHKKVIPLLGALASSGNSALMSGALGYREASLSFTARDSAERELVRGWEEASAVVPFTDYDGRIRNVILLSFDAGPLFADLWTVTVRLQERSEPV